MYEKKNKRREYELQNLGLDVTFLNERKGKALHYFALI
jgi:hypothetical protein